MNKKAYRTGNLETANHDKHITVRCPEKNNYDNKQFTVIP